MEKKTGVLERMTKKAYEQRLANQLIENAEIIGQDYLGDVEAFKHRLRNQIIENEIISMNLISPKNKSNGKSKKGS